MNTSHKVAIKAHPDFLEPLANELRELSRTQNFVFKSLDKDFFLIESTDPVDPNQFVWPLQVWTEANICSFESIKSASKILSQSKSPWQNLSSILHRRSELISQNINTLKLSDKIPFGATLYNDNVWALLDSQTLLSGKHFGPRTQNRNYEFTENKTEPPSRAYLKLWELFTRIQYKPKNLNLVELGASPGGWTWVAHSLGCRVFAFDRAPLADSLQKADSITFFKKDIFKINPSDLSGFGITQIVDGVLSDVIADSHKLAQLAKKWSSTDKSLCVFTIKFKGKPQMEPVYELLKEFPNSRAIHLEANKNEITWFLLNRN